jgi:hypothetical protein
MQTPPRPSLGSGRLPSGDGPTVSFGIGRLRLRFGLVLVLFVAAPGIAGGPRRMLLCAITLLSTAVAHQLAQSLCALAFHRRATIVLSVRGTGVELDSPLSGWRNVLTALAGPFVSVALGLACWQACTALPDPTWLRFAASVNLGWGTLNLLPVLPFGVGRFIFSSLPERQRAHAVAVSGAIAFALAIQGLVVRSALVFFVFGIAALTSSLKWLNLRQLEAEAELDLPGGLTRARRLLAHGELTSARRVAASVAAHARSRSTENVAWELLAWIELAHDRPAHAAAALARIAPQYAADSHCIAAVEAACGHPGRATSVLEGALALRALTPAALRLLIDLYAQSSAFDRACAVAEAQLDSLGVDDARRVVEAAIEMNAEAAAATLACRIVQRTRSPDDAVACAYCLAYAGDRGGAHLILSRLAQTLRVAELRPTTWLRLRDLATQRDLGDLLGAALERLAP